ncbi:hypothetical protein EVJ32_04675 [Exiguobacterium sp. SH5S4]|uniref:hypothetical protein n=1 Tax=Exiguobacterium sp. SH5S4 TaxID=2510961 RepID=UPI00103BEA97|nr:hypothetical protein [Exiguobacterium sp. SH5S4]TCI26672.1 hypothetical protein EVJ32_04675 [Exiguobacterium sp. SH5S4]
MRQITLYEIDELHGRFRKRAINQARDKYLKHLNDRQGWDVERAIKAFCKTFKTDILQYDVKPCYQPHIVLDTYYFSRLDNEDKNDLVDTINRNKEDDFKCLIAWDTFGDHYLAAYFAKKSGTTYNELESDIQKAVRFAVKSHLNNIFEESRNDEKVLEYAHLTMMGFNAHGSLEKF